MLATPIVPPHIRIWAGWMAILTGYAAFLLLGAPVELSAPGYDLAYVLPPGILGLGFLVSSLSMVAGSYGALKGYIAGTVASVPLFTLFAYSLFVQWRLGVSSSGVAWMMWLTPVIANVAILAGYQHWMRRRAQWLRGSR